MVKVIQQMHAHKDKANVHSVCLGVTRLHGNYMKDNGALTQPLNDLLSKESVFTWSEQQETAFNMVRQAMSDK